MNSLTFVIVGFQSRNKIDSQTNDNAVFDQIPISNAVCKIGSEKHPDDGKECDYGRDKYDQANSEIENFYHLKSETNFSTHLLICTNSEEVRLFMYSISPYKKSTLLHNQSD